MTYKKRRGPKKRFQYCVGPVSADTILHFRAFQGHSGGRHIGPTLQNSVLLPSYFAEHIHHVRRSHDTHSIIQSGLIPGGEDVKKRRHAVFVTARESKVHRSLQVAQVKGLQFCQTRSNGIIFLKKLPAMCIGKVVVRKSGEKICSKTYQSPIAPQRVATLDS